jgi:adenosylhomocysteine nucleosidase
MSPGTGDPVWHSDCPAEQVAVISALELEAEIARTATRRHRSRICVSGPGGDRALETARMAIARGARALISFGLAGGLSRNAATASVVLPQTIRSEAGAWAADTTWRGRLAGLLRSDFQLLEGTLFSAADVVLTPEAKARLAASSGADAVDMESAAIAAAAAAAGLPCIALRVIADGPDDALPDNVVSLVGPDGRTRLRSLTAFVFSPRRLRLLLGLAGRSRQARAELGRVTEALTRSVS